MQGQRAQLDQVQEAMAELVEDAREVASQAERVEEGLSALDQTHADVEQTFASLTEQIGQSLETFAFLGDLSRQIEVLALNLAVEANRSEHGRAFVVIAERMRELNLDVARSVYDARQRADALQNTSKATREAVGAVKQTLLDSAARARDISRRAGEQEHSSARVREALAAVALSLGELAEAADHQEDLAQDMVAASESLAVAHRGLSPRRRRRACSVMKRTKARTRAV